MLTYCLSEILFIMNKFTYFCRDEHVVMKPLLSSSLGSIQFYLLK